MTALPLLSVFIVEERVYKKNAIAKQGVHLFDIDTVKL